MTILRSFIAIFRTKASLVQLRVSRPHDGFTDSTKGVIVSTDVVSKDYASVRNGPKAAPERRISRTAGKPTLATSTAKATLRTIPYIFKGASAASVAWKQGEARCLLNFNSHASRCLGS